MNSNVYEHGLGGCSMLLRPPKPVPEGLKSKA